MSPNSLPLDLIEEMRAAREGDQASLGRVLARMRKYLCAIGIEESLGHGKAEMEDLVQDALLKAYRTFEQFQGTSTGELRSWLRQILLNSSRDAVRHWHAERRHPRREVQVDERNGDSWMEQLASYTPAPLAEMIRRETRDTIVTAIDSLRPDQARVITLRCHENQTFEQIAQQMQRSAEAARKLFDRALADLKYRLQEMREEDSDFKDAE